MNRKLANLRQKQPIQTRVMVDGQDEEKISLLLYGDIGSYYSYSGISLDSVVRELAGKSANTIEVYINSYGGDMFEAIAIKNYLIRRPEKIITYVDGIAASGGSIIAMAGEEIIMPKDAELMIHNPWTIAAGNAEDFRKIADEMDKANVSIQESYLRHFNATREELMTLLDAESWLTADEALGYGLATSLVEQLPKTTAPAAPQEDTANQTENLAAQVTKPKGTQKAAFFNL